MYNLQLQALLLLASYTLNSLLSDKQKFQATDYEGSEIRGLESWIPICCIVVKLQVMCQKEDDKITNKPNIFSSY